MPTNLPGANAAPEMLHVALADGPPVHHVVAQGPARAGIVEIPVAETLALVPAAVVDADQIFPPIGGFPPPLIMSFGGGPVAAGSGVQLIFWGSAWNAPTTSPSAAQLVANVQSILRGPWRTGLRQYGIGRVPFLGAMTVTQPVPPASFDDGDISSLFLRLVSGGVIPAAQVTLYLVFMPPGTNYGPGGIFGKHYAIPYQAPPLGPVTGWVGVVLNGSESQMSWVFSHELAEMLTDPNVFGGWTINGNPSAEIGDVCNGVTGVLSGVTVQSYWSLKDNACLIPTATSVRKTLALAGITLGGQGLRSIRDPIPSLNSLIDELFGAAS